jgi:exopolyphosphatase/guanosine-5'-triphosphate,3'-diphosphate pyrophosphatase
MRVAIIDLGTNSVRFDIHQIGPSGELKSLHREKLQIRLGQGVFLTGRLDPSAIRRALQAFESFHAMAQSMRVEKLVAFGTSALREAGDSDAFLKRIKTRTKINVRIISGEEEARYIAEGILANEQDLKGSFALVDIGGGSTEVSICKGRKVLRATSFALGTARLQQVFLKTIPPREPHKKGERRPVEALRSHIKGLVLSKCLAEDWPRVDRIVGSSGTIKALNRILKRKDKKAFSRSDLKDLVREMEEMTLEDLLSIPGMEARRADMILAGAVLLEEIASAMGATKIQATDYSLRDGILDEELKVLRQKHSTSMAFHIPELEEKALKLGCAPAHVRQVRRIAERLFDGLRAVHGLKPQWKPFLQAAAVLHDVGEAVSPTNHSLHSYYVVKNAQFPSMTEEESEFVAQLCLHHADAKMSGDLPFDGDKERQQAYVKCLALLRLADALDRGHKGNVDVAAIRADKREVRIRLKSRGAPDLELLRVEQKKQLFEQVFKRRVIVAAGR